MIRRRGPNPTHPPPRAKTNKQVRPVKSDGDHLITFDLLAQTDKGSLKTGPITGQSAGDGDTGGEFITESGNQGGAVDGETIRQDQNMAKPGLIEFFCGAATHRPAVRFVGGGLADSQNTG